MCAAVEDVHHRHGQNVCLKAAEEAIKRDILRLRRRIRCRNRNSKDRIRTELGLVLRAVQIEHRLIDRVDITCLEARKRGSDLFIYILDSLGNSFAAEFRLVAVTQLECLELPRRCPRGRCAAADRTVFENDLRFDRRIAARVDDLTTNNLGNS